MNDSVEDQGALALGTWIGREQAFNAMAHHCSAARAACLKQVRDSEAYKKLNLTWEEFCPAQAGLSRVQADRLIRQLDEFGAPYFQLTGIVPVSPATYREIAPAITDGALEYLGEQIPIIPENAVKIRTAVAALRKEISRLEDERSNRIPATITDLQMRFDGYCYDIERLQRRSQMLQREDPSLEGLITYSINKLNKLKPK